jgi:hypothetical protein
MQTKKNFMDGFCTAPLHLGVLIPSASKVIRKELFVIMKVFSNIPPVNRNPLTDNGQL